MRIFINDEPRELSKAVSLESLLSVIGIGDLKGWALALNDTIIPKSKLQETILGEGDRILLIRATQGG
jgi:sulfur carrier protein